MNWADSPVQFIPFRPGLVSMYLSIQVHTAFLTVSNTHVANGEQVLPAHGSEKCNKTLTNDPGCRL